MLVACRFPSNTVLQAVRVFASTTHLEGCLLRSGSFSSAPSDATSLSRERLFACDSRYTGAIKADKHIKSMYQRRCPECNAPVKDMKGHMMRFHRQSSSIGWIGRDGASADIGRGHPAQARRKQTAHGAVPPRRGRLQKTCPDCGKTFTRLRRHLMFVHKMKPGSEELRSHIRRTREAIDTSMVTGTVNNHFF
ncbi:hypothetical protein LSAT2_013928 [Lamellibrachia satsuma]|nr:hypothetical protein LSAT2_013928 [Lamellibrachia satsuma]